MGSLAGSTCSSIRNPLFMLLKNTNNSKLCSNSKVTLRNLATFGPAKSNLTTSYVSKYARPASAFSFCQKGIIVEVRHFSSLKDASKIEDEGDRNKTGGKSDESQTEKEEKAKADELSKRMMKYSFILFGVMFTGSAILILLEWGAPLKKEDGTERIDEFSDMNIVKQYILRTHKELLHYDKLIKDPSREKLLPDPLKEPYYQPPYTLVLEMTGVLVHPDWTYQTGWRFKKRPGVDFFLQQVGPPLFEVVIYTAEQGFTAFPIIDGLDPKGHIMYRLFRDATRYVDGHHIKDLSCLNRDLSKVIMVDWNEKSVKLNRENSLVIKKWKGDDDNRDLMDLAVFLHTVASSEVDDVRKVLDFYSAFDDPIAAFKENQKRISEESVEKEKQQMQTPSPTLVQSWSNSFVKRR